jgi:hypothetical protein
MSPKRFEERLHILVSTDERRMLDELAQRDGLTPSDVVRQLVRRAHAATFGEPPLKPKPRKRAAT